MNSGEKKIRLVNGKWDTPLADNGDFEQDDGLETAILMSLLLNERADESEVPQPTKRGGYWGYEVNDMMFCKLWLINGRRTRDKLNRAIDYANRALAWLIEEGYATDVETNAEFIENGISITVSITKNNTIIYSDTYYLWLNTDV